MKHRLLSLSAAVCLVGALPPPRTPEPPAPPPARAEGDIEWRSSLEGALKLATKESRVVFVAINMDGERANEQLALHTYHQDVIVGLSKNTVNLVGSIFDHKSGKRPCPRFGSVTCTEHREVEAAVHELLIGEEGRKISPQHVFLKPDGTVILTVPFAITPAELEWCFVAAIRKLDPKFAWDLSEKAHPPARLVMEGYEPEKKPEGRPAATAAVAPPTREETLHLLDQLKRNALVGPHRARAVNRIALADQEEAVEFMQGLLRRGAAGDKDARPGLIHNIGINSPPIYWQVLTEFAAGDDDAVRSEAIVALEQLGAPESVKALSAALSRERDPNIEKDLVRALASAGSADKRVRKTVVKLATKDRDRAVRVGAIIGLGYLEPNEDVREVLLGALHDESPEICVAAVCAMGMTRDAAWREVLVGYGAEARSADLTAAIRGSLAVLAGGDLNSIADPLMKAAGDEIRRERFFGK